MLACSVVSQQQNETLFRRKVPDTRSSTEFMRRGPAVLSFLLQTGRLAFLASWLADFFFQELEFLAFVCMNTPTYEWRLGSLFDPIRSLVVGILATVGGACLAAANPLPAGCGLYAGFSSCFSFTKRREGTLEKRSSAIHKNLPWHESPHMFFTLFSSSHVFTSPVIGLQPPLCRSPVR